MRAPRMASIFTIKGFIIAIICALVLHRVLTAIAPSLRDYIGPDSPLGKESFFMLRWGISREYAFTFVSWLIFHWVTWLIIVVIIAYQFLGIGVQRLPARPRFVAVTASFWDMRFAAERFLFGKAAPNEWRD